MQCKYGCYPGAKIYIRTCRKNYSEQLWRQIGDTIRPLNNDGLCITRVNSRDLRLTPCQRSSKRQEWSGIDKSKKFELKAKEGNKQRCVSQQHHPKTKETLYQVNCDEARRDRTSYWIVL